MPRARPPCRRRACRRRAASPPTRRQVPGDVRREHEDLARQLGRRRTGGRWGAAPCAADRCRAAARPRCTGAQPDAAVAPEPHEIQAHVGRRDEPAGQERRLMRARDAGCRRPRPSPALIARILVVRGHEVRVLLAGRRAQRARAASAAQIDVSTAPRRGSAIGRRRTVGGGAAAMTGDEAGPRHPASSARRARRPSSSRSSEPPSGATAMWQTRLARLDRTRRAARTSPRRCGGTPARCRRPRAPRRDVERRDARQPRRRVGGRPPLAARSAADRRRGRRSGARPAQQRSPMPVAFAVRASAV